MNTDNKSEVIQAFELASKNQSVFPAIDRQESIENFKRLGWPNPKNEEWKYTNINKIIQANPDFKKVQGNGVVTKEMVSQFLIAGADAFVLVFENGYFNKILSSLEKAPEGVTIQNLSSVSGNDTVNKYLGKVASDSNEPFVALNTAFVNDGVFIHIQPGKSISQPIHIIYINSSTNPDHTSSIRNLIVAEQGSKINISESYHSLNNDACGLMNSVTEVVVMQNAHVELVKAQLESNKSSHISFTQAIQERDSLFDTVTVTLNGDLVRNNLHIKMNDVNCTSHLYGLYILDGNQLVDNHTLVDHAMPNCYSNELYKGIIGGKAAGVFNGKIFVRKDAQKTNAYQSNKNILLTDDAQMNTKPQLEIFADDVKCTHGATIGQLDEEALFYLRTRGIGEKNARALLNIAFAGDVLNNIKNEALKENLLKLSIDKLHNNE